MADLNLIQTQPDPSGDPDLRVVTEPEPKAPKKRRTSSLYRNMRNYVMLRILFVFAIAAIFWAFIMVFFVDGIFNDAFPTFFVWLLERFHYTEAQANALYWTLIGDRKGLITFLIFLIIFLIVLWAIISAMLRSLDDLSAAIDNVIDDSDAPIRLAKPMKPVEEKLTRLKLSMRAKQKEAQEIEKKRNDLVLFLAHDLKTPLTSVIAYLSTLDANDSLPGEERKKYTHIALIKAHRLWDLIQEFFEITKYNLQGIKLEKTTFNLSMMLEQLADEMYAVLQEHGMNCEVHTDEDIIIDGDPDKLARVFDNLLRNAVNYSYRDTTIKIVAREVGEWIEIVFANRGNQIPESKLNAIFEKFYRADEARSSETGGAGLGLAIAKEIVEKHDGMISATSDEEETRFIVVLPEKTEEEREQKKERLQRRIEEAIKEEKIRV